MELIKKLKDLWYGDRFKKIESIDYVIEFKTESNTTILTSETKTIKLNEPIYYDSEDYFINDRKLLPKYVFKHIQKDCINELIQKRKEDSCVDKYNIFGKKNGAICLGTHIITADFNIISRHTKPIKYSEYVEVNKK